MRFVADGPDIPDELLFAQDEGNVVFFCGAGVSMAYAKLSSFADLAEKVINDLGETEESKAKKLFSRFTELNRDPYTRGVISADHIFSGLIRSFAREDINSSVARILQPSGESELTAHKIILKLARSQGGKTRLITTNFDLLFEACDKKLKSVTRSNLPHIQFTDNDWGVVHLHGKVKSDYSGPDRDGFVLSTSEFGDAYLAQGWARSFVKDVLEKFVAVFVGFSADDPPVRYLLEGLQQNGSGNYSIYAFQSADDEVVAQWNEKGVTPIVYNLHKDDPHAPLWRTLNAWGLRSKNPIAWKNKLLSKARKGPSKLQAHERGMVAHLIKSRSGARAFSQANPPLPSDWICVFDSKIRLQQVEHKEHLYNTGEIINPYQLFGIDSDPPPSDRNKEFSHENKPETWDAFVLNDADYEDLNEGHLPSVRSFRSSNPAWLPARLNYLAIWISKVADQRIIVWWAGRQISLHPDLLKYVNRELSRNDIPGPIIENWHAIFELSYFYGRKEHQEYELSSRIKTFGWSNFIVREYAKISAPFLKIGSLYRSSIPRDNRKKLNKYSLVRVDVDYPEGIYDINVPNEYLPQVVNALRINLEHAVDMEKDFSVWLEDICAIEPDDIVNGHDTPRGYGLSAYVLHFVSLFRKLVAFDIKQASQEFKRWRRDDHTFTRLRVWACGLKGLIDGAEFTNEILSLSDEDFWPYKGERDLLISLKNKWNDLSKENRDLVEKRILKGPPKPRKVPNAVHLTRSSHKQLNRLHWLNNQGCELCLNLSATSVRLRKMAPEWRQEYAEKAAESHDPHSGWVRTDTNWSSLNNIPLTKIIETAQKKKSRDYQELTEYAPFAGLCDDRPLRAIAALSIELKNGRFYSNFWETYLSRETRKQDKYRLKLLVAGRITQIANKNLKDILLTASRWFEDQGPELRKKNRRIFDALWNKFIQTITEHTNSSGSALVRREGNDIDWTGEAINSPSGNMAELHMTDPIKENLKSGSGFPKEWLRKADQLLSLPNDAHRYAMTIFSFNLGWFHNIDPKWTESKLIKIIEDDKASKDDKAAIWAGFMWGARTPNEKLYVKLKPHFLKMASERTSERRRHVEVLSALLLSGWGSKDKEKRRYVSDEELRNVLLVAGEDYRGHTLWHLDRWSKDGKNNWDKKVLPFLQKVWPKHKKVRTNKMSARLCELALNQKENFPAICKLVTQLISKIGNEHVFIPEIRKVTKDENGEHVENLAEKYPGDYLNLMYAMLPEQPEWWPYGTAQVLRIIEISDPGLLNDPKLIELKSRLNDH